MPYTHFRFIAYEVPTATSQTGVPNAPVVCDYAPGQECPANAKLPVPNDTPDDPRIRLRRLAAVVALAANWLTLVTEDDVNTLKVFVVPEFYFRPPEGLGNAYKGQTYRHSDFLKIITALNGMFVHNDFANWLFVPGTILFNTLEIDPEDPLFRNTLTHIWGGRANSMQFIEKNQPSSIDGVPLVGVPARDAVYGLYHASWNNQKEHVATINGSPLGFEVCLDHLNKPSCRVLKTVLSKWQQNEGQAPPGLSLHILSAGGMSIEAGSVAAKLNGYILRNDGKANPGARSELRQVQAYNVFHPPMINPGAATTPDDLTGIATLGAPVAEEWSTPLTGARQVPQRQGFATFPQRIVFYPKLQLA